MQTIFKKWEYHFLVKSTKIENATYSYKTVVSEANIQANVMRST